MIWKVWTIKLWLCGVKLIEATARLDAVGWPVETEHELQRARARQQQQPQSAAAAAVCEEKEHAHVGRAAGDEALDVVNLTAWFGTKAHVRDAARVARAAVKRGLSEAEAIEAREWLRQRRTWTDGEPDGKELSDAEWLATLTQAERDAMK